MPRGVVGCEQSMVDGTVSVLRWAVDGAVLCKRCDAASVDGASGRMLLKKLETFPSLVLQVFSGELTAEESEEL